MGERSGRWEMEKDKDIQTKASAIGNLIVWHGNWDLKSARQCGGRIIGRGPSSVLDDCDCHNIHICIYCK